MLGGDNQNVENEQNKGREHSHNAMCMCVWVVGRPHQGKLLQ